MKFTLRAKFISLTTFIVASTMAIATYFFTIRELHDKRTDFELQMKRIAENIATVQLLDRQNWEDYQSYITHFIKLNDDIIYIAIFDARNWLRAHALNTDLVEIDFNLQISRTAQAEIVRRLDKGLISKQNQNDMSTQRVNIQSGDIVLGSVHVGFSLIEINDKLQNSIARNAAIAFIFMLIFSTISIFLSRHLTRPLERLNLAMAAIKQGRLDQNVKAETRDEIGKLTLTFNEMAAGLRERKIIEQLSQEIGQVFQLEQLGRLVRNRIGNAIGADNTRLYLRKKNDANLFEEIASNHTGPDHGQSLLFDSDVQAVLCENTNGIVFHEAPAAIKASLKPIQLSQMDLVIPMQVKNQLFGLLIFQLVHQDKSIDGKTQQFIATLARQAAVALENALLYEELKEQERLKRELEIAREVQQKLLPIKAPVVPGFEVEGMCKSADEVGGDYFDFFELDKEHFGFVIADVSGKGTSASFYMAEIKGMMSSLVSANLSPQKVLSALNRRLYISLDKKVFATMIYGVLNVTSKSFTFVRAGHNALLHKNGNQHASFVTPPGIGLGLEAGKIFEATLQEITLILADGDTILLFTDGITESMNLANEQFGEDRLLELLNQNEVRSAKKLQNTILDKVDSFAQGAKQHDDLTMVVLHCRKNNH
ncbi:MAG: SpoIIE family protein phosphatase [bacterium]